MTFYPWKHPFCYSLFSVLKRLRRSLAVVVLGTMSTLQMTHVRLFDGYLLSKEAQVNSRKARIVERKGFWAGNAIVKTISNAKLS